MAIFSFSGIPVPFSKGFWENVPGILAQAKDAIPNNPNVGYNRPVYTKTVDEQLQDNRPSYAVAPNNSDIGYTQPAYAKPYTPEVLPDNRPSYATPVHNPNVGYDRPSYATASNVADIGYARPSYTYGPHMSAEELAAGIMAGKFGNGANRKAQLAQMGYSPEEIAAAQGLINQRMASPRAAVSRHVPRSAPVSAPVSAPPPQAYAYQNVPAPAPVSQEPEWGTYDYYRKYVLKG